MTTLVDTAALAAHLGCTPDYVRLMVRAHVLTPIGRRRLRLTGRPSMWFDLDQVDDQLDAARAAGRVRLDNDRWRLRNS